MGVLFSSCSKLESDNGQNLILSLEQPQTTKVTLLNPMSLSASERLWCWEDGDIPLLILMKDGNEMTIPVFSAERIDAEPSIMKVRTGKLPQNAILKGAAFGSINAYGKSCKGDENIPSSMVYAKAEFFSIGNVTELPNLTLQHLCSYYLIVPDTVDGNQMTSFTITGKGLKGGKDSHTIRLSFKDSQSGTYEAKWVSVCNTATEIIISVTAGGKNHIMATFADAGKGKCNLYYVRNKTIGVEYK